MPFRTVLPADYPALSALHHAAFPRGWSGRELLELTATPGCEAFVAEKEGKAVGFILLRAVEEEAEILTLVVDPAHKRKGWGRALLEHGWRALEGKGVCRLFLEVADDNTAAISLYHQAGFSTIGRRKGYYLRLGAPRADALLMQRSKTGG